MAEKNKIRVRSQTEYVIEVNDAGETISFDLADVSLSSRLFKTYELIDRLTAEYEAKAKEIDARPDKTLYIFGEPYSEQVIGLTQNQRDGAELIDRFYSDARAALDEFLGPGACKKIFGEKNYLTMFHDLIVQLEPHFKKMNLNLDGLKKTAAEKYKPNRQQRRALE